MKSLKYVVLFLSAIVMANLLTAHFGPSITILNAFLFIGLDLTSRDKLHDLWRNNLPLKMFILIITGSIISFMMNRGSGMISIASVTAFALATIVDTILYEILKRNPKIIQVNGSNIGSALVDSLVFPTVAFGGFLPSIVLGQFLAKVIGGFMWSLILNKFRKQS